MITPPFNLRILDPLTLRASRCMLTCARYAYNLHIHISYTFLFDFLSIPHFYNVPHFGVARRSLRRSPKFSLTSQTVRPPARDPLLNI
jgi:hypothetical protein